MINYSNSIKTAMELYVGDGGWLWLLTNISVLLLWWGAVLLQRWCWYCYNHPRKKKYPFKGINNIKY
jgi:hypothetical protein